MKTYILQVCHDPKEVIWRCLSRQCGAIIFHLIANDCTSVWIVAKEMERGKRAKKSPILPIPMVDIERELSAYSCLP